MSSAISKNSLSLTKQMFVGVALFFTAVGGFYGGLKAVEALAEMTFVTRAQAADISAKTLKECKDADLSVKAELGARLDYIDVTVERNGELVQKIYDHLLAGSLKK